MHNYKIHVNKRAKMSSLLKYFSFLDCLSFLGMNIKAEISVAKNATYTSDKAIQEMLYVLSEVIEMGILKEMKESDHFALMFEPLQSS